MKNEIIIECMKLKKKFIVDDIEEKTCFCNAKKMTGSPRMNHFSFERIDQPTFLKDAYYWKKIKNGSNHIMLLEKEKGM